MKISVLAVMPIKFSFLKIFTEKELNFYSSCGNTETKVSALLILRQFKVFLKGGFMLILLIRHANVSGCYALEQGTRPGLITCDPRRQFVSLSLSLSLPCAYSKCVFRETQLAKGGTSTYRHHQTYA